jgi:hypothetical protein
LNLEFVPPDLESVPPGLDFVPENLDFLHCLHVGLRGGRPKIRRFDRVAERPNLHERAHGGPAHSRENLSLC